MPRLAPLLLVLLVGCGALETSVLYHPVHCRPDEYQAPPPPLQDVKLRTSDGTTIHARWCPHPKATGAILFCHGNAGNLDGRARVVREVWEQLGESVLIFDYPGYGHSDGSPSEAGCYAAAEAAFRWLTVTARVPADRVVLYGESLGGGVATELATRHSHRALVLCRTFTSVPDVARERYAPLHVLVGSSYDNLAKLPRTSRPVFIAQAERDEVVGPHHGERLHAACPGRSELLRLERLGHNDPLPPEFFGRLRDFLRTRAPTEP